MGLALCLFIEQLCGTLEIASIQGEQGKTKQNNNRAKLQVGRLSSTHRRGCRKGMGSIVPKKMFETRLRGPSRWKSGPCAPRAFAWDAKRASK